MAMAELKFPVTKIDNNKFQVVVDMALYAKEAIVAACYKLTDRFFVHHELIDQQVRHNTNLQFGHIRELIVEEAFKPVSK